MAAAWAPLTGCAPRADGEPGTAAAAVDTSAAYAARTAALAPEAGDVRLASDVLVRRIAPGLWMHVTLGTLRGPVYYPANGMLLETDSGSVLFDTGWNDAQTRVLLDWAARTLRHPVRLAVGTHFHADRLSAGAW